MQFKQYLAEMDFKMGNPKKLEPARATYPKTNYKRFMDNWNEKMGAWVKKAEGKGWDVKKRTSLNDDYSVYDMIDDEGSLQSTLVITGGDDVKSGDHTFDFYNQNDPHQDNEFRVLPERTKYEDWHWSPITGEDKHHSDQRNMFTSSNPARTMANSRRKDGETLQDIISSKRK